MPRRLSTLAPLAALLLTASAIAGSAGSAAAVHTTYWTVSRESDFREGKVEDVSIESPGTVSLAPKVDARGEGGALYGWSLVAGSDGNFYVGTGDDGKVYRVTPAGEQTEWFDTIEMEALSLAFDGKGRLYAGGSPDGTIFRITGRDEGGVFIDTPENYIWALAFAPSGDLYAATGSRGLIYKVDASGKGSVLLDTQDKNVLALVYDAVGKSLVAGTEGRGLVLRVGLDGKSSVLFDSGHEEIGAVAVAADGTIYAAGSGRGEEAGKPERDGRDRERTGGTTSSAKASDGDIDKSAAKTKGDATVYRIAPDGVVRRLWISEEQFIYSLLVRDDGTLIVGTGDEGAVYRVDADGKATLLTNLDESQALDMIEVKSGIFISTGNLGRVYKLGPERETSGTVESIAYDARNAARWGSLSWVAETPSGTKVAFRTRGGNTDKPDETWSEWSSPLTDPAGSPITSERSRFLQWRAELSSGGGETTPRLLEVRVAFVEANLPPLVGEVEVQPQNTVIYEGDPDDRQKPLFQVLPDGAQVEFTLDRRDDQVFDEAASPWARSIRTVRWDALDPNGDALSYDLYFKGLDESRWKLFKKEHDMPFFAWNSESFADGEYQVRIVASDRRDNPRGQEQTGEGVSESFSIDNSPPEITDLSAGRSGRDGLTVSATARDARSLLKRAQYTIDARPWAPIATSDGVFDSREETFRFESDSLDAGEHTVVLKVFDEHGNARVARATVR